MWREVSPTCYDLNVCDFSKPIRSDRIWLISKSRTLRTCLELDGGVHTKLVNTLIKKLWKPFCLSTMKTKADNIILEGKDEEFKSLIGDLIWDSSAY